jgi:hypothetical protein
LLDGNDCTGMKPLLGMKDHILLKLENQPVYGPLMRIQKSEVSDQSRLFFRACQSHPFTAASIPISVTSRKGNELVVGRTTFEVRHRSCRGDLQSHEDGCA